MRSVRSSQNRVATTQVQAKVGISSENDSESARHRPASAQKQTICPSVTVFLSNLLHSVVS